MGESSLCLMQIVNKYIACHKSKFTNNGDISATLREEENDITGVLEICGSPHWGLVLKDSSYRLPCILFDTTSQLEKLINCLSCTIGIAKGYVVVERYRNSEADRFFIYFQFYLDDVYIIKSPKSPCSEILPMHWNQQMYVVHVTTPIFVSDTCTYSLVLVMILLQGEDPKYLWIVLRNKQVVWNVFLMPNREYNLHMMVTKEYFKESVRPLRAVVGRVKGVKILAEILHHPELWPTFDAVDLPENTEISLEPSTNREKFNCRLPSVWWLSVDEALAEGKEKIVSIWGEVVKVMHNVTEDRDGCSLCSIKKCKLKENLNIPVPETTSWTNPWESSFKLKSRLRLPVDYAEEKNGTAPRTSFPDKLTKVVVLKDEKSGKTATLYLKKWSQHQYSGLFTTGVILCAKFVHKRVSAKKNSYFCSSALSSFELVSCTSAIRDVISCSSTKYGFPFLRVLPQSKVWGVLDLWSLLKVNIGHSSDEKNVVLKESDAENQLAALAPKNKKDSYSPTAVLQMDSYSLRGSSVKVILKDDHVRDLLDIPLNFWNCLVCAAKTKPLKYNARNEEEMGDREIDLVFHAYCSIISAEKHRFHISCRLLDCLPGEDEVYFCTSLGEADNKHLLDVTT